MTTKNAQTTKSTKTGRENPDPNLVCATADLPNRRTGGFPLWQGSTGANAASGDAETALLAGAP